MELEGIISAVVIYLIDFYAERNIFFTLVCNFSRTRPSNNFQASWEHGIATLQAT